MARIKGVALLSRMAMLKEHYGDDAVMQVLALMSADNRTLLTAGGLLSSSWYPAEVFKELNEAIFQALKAKDPNVMEKLGELTAELGLTTIHKMKVKETPEETIRRIPMLWDAFHDTGKFSVDSQPGRVTFRIEGYGLPHREFCRNLNGWGKKIIELSGGKNAVAKDIQCVCNGDPVCETVISWDV